MTHFTTRVAARLAAEQARAGRRFEHRAGLQRRDRGDVPGWVLITVMTAGLVSAIWILAGPALSSMFTNALSSVTGK